MTVFVLSAIACVASAMGAYRLGSVLGFQNGYDARCQHEAEEADDYEPEEAEDEYDADLDDSDDSTPPPAVPVLALP